VTNTITKIEKVVYTSNAQATGEMLWRRAVRWTRRRAGGCRRARCTHHDQHRPHGRDLRRRRRATACGRLAKIV